MSMNRGEVVLLVLLVLLVLVIDLSKCFDAIDDEKLFLLLDLYGTRLVPAGAPVFSHRWIGRSAPSGPSFRSLWDTGLCPVSVK